MDILLYVVGILVIVVGLALSIGLHEIGHLLPAKLFGVRVTQYMIGFGPTIFSRRRGETEYGVKLLPLGGYIAMSGMYPPAKDGARARTASTGLLNGLVQEGTLDEPPARRSGFGTIIDDARAASAESIAAGEEHRTFYELPVFKRIVIMLGGPAMNLVLAVVFTAIVLCGFGVAQPSTTLGAVNECVQPATSTAESCAADDPAAPGALAGLEPGDQITAIDGEPVENWEAISASIREAPGDDLAVTLVRDGTEQTVTVTPLLTERAVLSEEGEVVVDAEGETVTEQVGFVGIVPAYETVRQSAGAVLPAVGDNIVRVGELILQLPQRLVDVAQAAFGTEERDPNGPLSVVGVGRLAGEVASLDTIPVVERVATMVNLLGSLNVALFVFNLIPLMPLDGGHVAGALYEGARRRVAKLFGRPDPGPFDAARFVPVTLAVAVVLGAMGALLIYADLVNPVSLLG